MRRADAGDPDSLTSALANIEPEVLIYNAFSITPSNGGPSTLAPSTLVAEFRVNVLGALVSTQAVLPGMLRRGRGSILFTGGGIGLDPTNWLPAASLGVSKAGLRNLTQSLHAELGPKGVHVATVTITGMIQPGSRFDPDRIADVYWSLHTDGKSSFRAEVVFAGDR
jgi:short-subunit dehydrogenase